MRFCVVSCYRGNMNERFQPDLPWPATTQAADGMPRRPWTVAEIKAMVKAGIIEEDERFELIGGEVVPMSPKGARHEMVKIELNRHFQRTVSDELRVAQETTLRLDEINFLEPDFCVFPKTIYPGDLRGYHVLLAVEAADTSLRYDLGRKLGLCGVRHSGRLGGRCPHARHPCPSAARPQRLCRAIRGGKRRDADRSPGAIGLHVPRTAGPDAAIAERIGTASAEQAHVRGRSRRGGAIDGAPQSRLQHPCRMGLIAGAAGHGRVPCRS